MTRKIVTPWVLVLALLCLSSALPAAPRQARVVLGMKELTLSPKAVVEGKTIYVPVDILKSFGASYVAGKRKVTVALEGGPVEIDIVSRANGRMIRLDAVAKAFDAEYFWDDASSTATLPAKLVSVKFSKGVFVAKLTLPVQASSVRLWPKDDTNPWRISIDLPGARLATDAKTYPVVGSSVKKIRLGQFNKETTRVVLDLDEKTSFKLLTNGASREIEVAVGNTQPTVAKMPANTKKPGQTQAVKITGITIEPEGDSKIKFKVKTSATPSCNTFMLGASPTMSSPMNPRIVIDFAKASFDMSRDEIKVNHPLLKSIRTGIQPDAARIVCDVDSYVAFTSVVDDSGITVTVTPPKGAGGRLKDKLIVLDPGHGGYQAGACAAGIKEKDLTLIIAQRVKQGLEEAGAEVILTREEDKYVDLPSRPKIAADNNADVFISIHCNALGVPNKRSGIETYYHPNQPSSRALAYAVHGQIIRHTGMIDKGARLDTTLSSIGLSVLRNANVPAVLIECGYLDHSSDRKLLCDDEYRGKLADAIVEGLKEYIEGDLESASRPVSQADTHVLVLELNPEEGG